jgi:hypothetical protein
VQWILYYYTPVWGGGDCSTAFLSYIPHYSGRLSGLILLEKICGLATCKISHENLRICNLRLRNEHKNLLCELWTSK